MMTCVLRGTLKPEWLSNSKTTRPRWGLNKKEKKMRTITRMAMLVASVTLAYAADTMTTNAPAATPESMKEEAMSPVTVGATMDLYSAYVWRIHDPRTPQGDETDRPARCWSRSGLKRSDPSLYAILLRGEGQPRVNGRHRILKIVTKMAALRKREITKT